LSKQRVYLEVKQNDLINHSTGPVQTSHKIEFLEHDVIGKIGYKKKRWEQASGLDAPPSIHRKLKKSSFSPIGFL